MNKHKLLCHRDLKPENFLLNDDFDIEIADFGFCTEILTNEDKNGKATDRMKDKTHYACRGTLQYMAPELLDQAVCTTKGYNPEQTDIFSLGIILFSMLMGKPPFR